LSRHPTRGALFIPAAQAPEERPLTGRKLSGLLIQSHSDERPGLIRRLADLADKISEKDPSPDFMAILANSPQADSYLADALAHADKDEKTAQNAARIVRRQQGVTIRNILDAVFPTIEKIWGKNKPKDIPRLDRLVKALVEATDTPAAQPALSAILTEKVLRRNVPREFLALQLLAHHQAKYDLPVADDTAKKVVSLLNDSLSNGDAIAIGLCAGILMSSSEDIALPALERSLAILTSGRPQAQSVIKEVEDAIKTFETSPVEAPGNGASLLRGGKWAVVIAEAINVASGATLEAVKTDPAAHASRFAAMHGSPVAVLGVAATILAAGIGAFFVARAKREAARLEAEQAAGQMIPKLSQHGFFERVSYNLGARLVLAGHFFQNALLGREVDGEKQRYLRRVLATNA
jgi:hypothetical protein